MSHPPRRFVPLVLAAAAAAVASCGGDAGVNTPSPAPPGTPPPSVAPGALQPGSRISGDTFTAAVPLDWSAKPTTTPTSGGPQSATVRQTEIDAPPRDASLDILEYPFSIFPAATLNDTLDNFVARVINLPTGSASAQAVTPRKHVTVAGEDAVELAFQDTFKGTPGYTRLAVFKHSMVVYVVTLGTKPTLAASYSPALDTLLSTWRWK